MCAKDLQMMDDSTIDGSRTKTDFLKKNHQRGAQVDEEDQYNNFYFGKILFIYKLVMRILNWI